MGSFAFQGWFLLSVYGESARENIFSLSSCTCSPWPAFLSYLAAAFSKGLQMENLKQFLNSAEIAECCSSFMETAFFLSVSCKAQKCGIVKKKIRLWLSNRRNILKIRTVWQWNRLLQKVVTSSWLGAGCPSVRDAVIVFCMAYSISNRNLDSVISKIPSNSNILWLYDAGEEKIQYLQWPFKKKCYQSKHLLGFGCCIRELSSFVLLLWWSLWA